MRITFLTSKLNFDKSGGSVEEIDLLARTLIELGHDVTVVTVYSNGNGPLPELPYRVIQEQKTSTGLVGIAWNFFSLLRKYADRTDCFHIDHLGLYGAGLYRRLGGAVPTVTFFNSFLGCWPDTSPTLFKREEDRLVVRFKKRMRWYVEKYIGMPLANGGDLFTFVSPPVMDLYNAFGIRSSSSMAIGDLIDYRKIMAINGITNDSYTQKNRHDPPIVLFYSSRMIQGKGFDLLIDGFSRVKNKEKYRLILGGTGPQEQLVHDMVKRLGLERYVELPGWVSKEALFAYYKKADIFIQVGWRPEGTSISLLYAMAFGVPSILPGGGGLQWAAKNSAYYVKNGDPDALATAIETLGDNPAFRERLSRGCYERIAEDEMDYRVQIKKLSAEMEGLVSNQRQ
jgi:glycosyltransferase involved in cell wall biosynthesis